MAQTVDVMQLSLHFRYITVSKFSPYTHCHVTFNNSVIPHLLFPVPSSLSLPPRPVPPFSPPSPFPYPQSPSVYSSYRRKALEFTFSCLSETLGHREAEDEPLFLYGDFNFRLDFSAVVKVRTCCNCRLNTLFYTQALHVKSLCTLYVYKGGQVLTFSLLPSPSSPPCSIPPGGHPVQHILTANHHTKFVNTENGSINRIEYRAEDSSDDNVSSVGEAALVYSTLGLWHSYMRYSR